MVQKWRMSVSYTHLIRNAGSIFLGRNVPEALGDYFAGPNHTLPTSGTARFSSPLGVDDFCLLYTSAPGAKRLAQRLQDFEEDNRIQLERFL